jgi:uncharacterized cupin superfamily protein
MFGNGVLCGKARRDAPKSEVQMSQAPGRKTLAVAASDVPVRTKPSVYPEPFRNRIEGREKRPLGDFFGLNNFGVNLTTLAPGSQSALLHRHSKQDEFIYIIEGQPTPSVPFQTFATA